LRIFPLIFLLFIRYNKTIEKRRENPDLEAGNMKMTFLLSIGAFLLSMSSISFGANPLVAMETNFGDMTLELYPDEAPITVDNFLDYVNSGFYDGLVFHRVIQNFMIQAGAYYVDGYTIYQRPVTREPIVNESYNGLRNLRGTIAMATTADPNSATSQFFINHVDNPHLDHDYPDGDGSGHCVFGQIIEGLDILDSIALAEVCYINPSLAHFPCNPPVEIISVYEIPEPMAVRPVLVALSQGDETGLLLKGSPTLTVITEDADTCSDLFDIYSSAEDALLVQGNANVIASKLNISGGKIIKGSLNYPDDMVISEKLGDIGGLPPDLFEHFEPDYTGLLDKCPVDPVTGKTMPLVITADEWVLEAGYYSEGIIIEDASVLCLPGIYHLGGGVKAKSGLILKGTAVVDANEVMFHLIEAGQVSIGGDAKLKVSEPAGNDDGGFVFFQTPGNTSEAVFKGVADCGGTLYFPSNHIDVTGNVLCSILMANTIELAGDAELTVNPNYQLSE
jgi:cyclophilin family peptidyl-prolyl cis-trans isomerase